jgi:trehalose 6-phosphate phosphatase
VNVSSLAGKAGNIAGLLEPLRAEPESSAIFCDIDGTIAPIVERAADARVLPETRELLGGLAGRYALVGCLSGRRAVEARALTGRDDLVYIGNHGFERLLPGQDEPTPAPGLRGHEDATAAFLDQHADLAELERTGLRLEDKGPIKALHWRGADDEAAAEARARELASEAVGFGLIPHWGRKVLEIRPAVELSKGTALAELLEENRIANALYGGDDRTDVDAFRTLRDMTATGDLRAAVCIGIASAEGPPEVSQEADAVVEGPEGFVATLRLLE